MKYILHAAAAAANGNMCCHPEIDSTVHKLETKSKQSKTLSEYVNAQNTLSFIFISIYVDISYIACDASFFLLI